MLGFYEDITQRVLAMVILLGAGVFAGCTGHRDKKKKKILVPKAQRISEETGRAQVGGAAPLAASLLED